MVYTVGVTVTNGFSGNTKGSTTNLSWSQSGNYSVVCDANGNWEYLDNDKYDYADLPFRYTQHILQILLT